MNGHLSFSEVPVFEIGDQVLVSRNPVLERNRSLLFPYEGPAVIISRIWHGVDCPLYADKKDARCQRAQTQAIPPSFDKVYA